MPLSETSYPPSEEVINGSEPTFLIFYSAREQGYLWCPHCRDVDGIVSAAFSGAKKPRGTIVSVGSFADWKTPSKPHPARARWGIQYVPTILKIQNGKEVDRATKLDILDSEKFERFLQA